MVRVGIAGIGFIAEEYIKLKTEEKITDCRICALCSRNKQHMLQVKKTYGLDQAMLFTEYNEMLDSGVIDAVLICTPHFFHIKMAEAALHRGIHVLIEKPVGVFGDEAESLLQTIRLYPELTAGVLYCRRTGNAYRELHGILSERKLGAIKRVNWQITNLYRTQAYHSSQPWKGTWRGEGGGLLLTQASHQLDLLVWLLGMPERLQAFCGYGLERDIEVENEVFIQMWYLERSTAQFIASSREFPGTNRLEISGSKGQIILEQDRSMTYRWLAMDEREYSRTTDEIYGSVPYTEEMKEFNDTDNRVQQAAIVNNFIQAVQGREKILCPVEEAAQSLNIINGAYLSSWKNKMVSFPLDMTLYRKEWEKAALNLKHDIYTF